MSVMRYILASGSLRRIELIHLTGYSFEPIKPDVLEVIDQSLTAEEAAIDLAMQKLKATKYNSEDVVLACDTIVSCDGNFLGKPLNEGDAYKMLQCINGKNHRVVTGCALYVNNKIETFFGEAEVSFNHMSDEEIKAYINTQEPFGKAGAYAIQGYAAKHISQLKGDYYSVMGLPIAKLYNYLKEN